MEHQADAESLADHTTARPSDKEGPTWKVKGQEDTMTVKPRFERQGEPDRGAERKELWHSRQRK